MLSQLLQKALAHPRQVFFIDGLGALLTAVMLGIVLAQWEAFFGMPRAKLYILAGVAVIFAVYSLTCYWRLPTNWRPYLRAIAATNLLYCCVTAGLVVYLYKVLTVWGVLYFVGEILIVVSLAIFEWKVGKQSC